MTKDKTQAHATGGEVTFKRNGTRFDLTLSTGGNEITVTLGYHAAVELLNDALNVVKQSVRLGR